MWFISMGSEIFLSTHGHLLIGSREAIQIKGADRWIYDEELWISHGVSINHWNIAWNGLHLAEETQNKLLPVIDRPWMANTNDG